MHDEDHYEHPKKKRRRKPRGLFLLPHLFTTANLFWGFYAIVHATSQEYEKAALGIVLAAIFDLFDGRIARMSGTESEFGAEYDSLADLVAFGIAPALLAMHAGNLLSLGGGRTGWVIAFLFTVCAALRLARFNVHDSPYKGWFEGLPSPAAGGSVAVSIWFHSFLTKGMGLDLNLYGFEWIAALGLAALGLLMVSPIPYRSAKELHLRQSYRTLVFAVIFFVVVMVKPTFFLFVLAVTYVLSGPLEALWRKVFHHPLVAVASGLSEELEESSGEL